MQRARSAAHNGTCQVVVLRPDRQDLPVFVIHEDATVAVYTTVRQAQRYIARHDVGDNTLIFDKRLRRYGFVAGRLGPVAQLRDAELMPFVRASWGLYAEKPEELPGWMEWHLTHDVVQ